MGAVPPWGNRADQIWSVAGQGGIPLNNTGRQQALAAAEELAGAGQRHMAFSSTLGRASETARVISTRLGVDAVAEVPALVERGYGSAEGANITGFDEVTKRSLMEGGESVKSVVSRGTAAFDWLKSVYPELRIVIFSHGTLIRLLFSDLYGKEHLRVANAEVTEFGVNLIQGAGVRVPQLH
ncbi:histidine phosphatase family protein [Arthrobacter sp. MYb213]|uniref:histidine phosphatase family protein n=1 Tax=Arthrobacter sp. MYb213 TaxID=1848595 RepID=UPI0015E3974A|nr:histidine phosphatase family protein [Arthrobacter sp. MYb213]